MPGNYCVNEFPQGGSGRARFLSGQGYLIESLSIGKKFNSAPSILDPLISSREAVELKFRDAGRWNRLEI